MPPKGRNSDTHVFERHFTARVELPAACPPQLAIPTFFDVLHRCISQPRTLHLAPEPLANCPTFLKNSQETDPMHYIKPCTLQSRTSARELRNGPSTQPLEEGLSQPLGPDTALTRWQKKSEFRLENELGIPNSDAVCC